MGCWNLVCWGGWCGVRGGRGTGLDPGRYGDRLGTLGAVVAYPVLLRCGFRVGPI